MSGYENKYVEQGNEYSYLKKFIECSKKGKSTGILLRGPPGVGKTLCAICLAKDFGADYYIIDGSPQLDRRDIEGCWEIEGGNTVFNGGPLVKAFKSANEKGIAFLIINEINAIRENEQISLNSTLSESHINLISKPEWFGLECNAKLIIIGTMNKDVAGVNSLQEAFDDRFMLKMVIDYPKPKKEIEIIQKITSCSEQLASLVVELGGHLRKAALKEMTLGKIFSTRLAVNFCQIVKMMKLNFIEQNIQNMIINKIADEKIEEETITHLIEMVNFTSRLNSLFSMAISESVHKAINQEEVTSEMNKVVKNIVLNDNINVFRGGMISYTFLEYLWKQHKILTQQYFFGTLSFEAAARYKKTTGKNPTYGSVTTFTYIYWLYQHEYEFLMKYMTNVQPILEVFH